MQDFLKFLRGKKYHIGWKWFQGFILSKNILTHNGPMFSFLPSYNFRKLLGFPKFSRSWKGNIGKIWVKSFSLTSAHHTSIYQCLFLTHFEPIVTFFYPQKSFLGGKEWTKSCFPALFCWKDFCCVKVVCINFFCVFLLLHLTHTVYIYRERKNLSFLLWKTN